MILCSCGRHAEKAVVCRACGMLTCHRCADGGVHATCAWALDGTLHAPRCVPHGRDLGICDECGHLPAMAQWTAKMGDEDLALRLEHHLRMPNAFYPAEVAALLRESARRLREQGADPLPSLGPFERGIILVSLRFYRRKLEKSQASLVARFGDGADLAKSGSQIEHAQRAYRRVRRGRVEYVTWPVPHEMDDAV